MFETTNYLVKHVNIGHIERDEDGRCTHYGKCNARDGLLPALGIEIVVLEFLSLIFMMVVVMMVTLTRTAMS